MNDQAAFVDLSLDQVGVAPDGRPTYQQVDPLRAGCNATFDGIRQGFSGVTPECIGGNQDVFFTNQPGNGGSTFTTSFQASKNFDFDSGWGINFSGGYAYNESEVANPGSSFTAAENFRAVIATDIVNLDVGDSWRNTSHNFVLAATFAKSFWGDNRSAMSLFFQRRSGGPISPVYMGGPYGAAIGDSAGSIARNLLYVPTDASDARVNFGAGFDTDAFFAWADRQGLKRGKIQKIGTLDQDWSTDLDLRFSQEIPFFGESKGMIYLDIENVLNLINDDWGVKTYTNTQNVSGAIGVVEADINAVDPTQYDYISFTDPSTAVSPDSWDSLYRIQLGLRVTF